MSIKPATVEAAGKTPESTTRAPRRALVLAMVAGLVVALFIAGTFLVLWLQASETSPEEVRSFLSEQRPEIESVTTEVVDALTNYDETNIAQLRERMIRVSTGSFLDKFEELFQAGLPEAIESASVSSRGRIISGPDVSFRGPSEAVAIVSVTQTFQNRTNPGGETIDYGLEIDLVDTADGGWKADDVVLLSESN
jgi:hypothetical protein